MKVRVATRRSALALVQTRWVAAQIRAHAPGTEVEEVPIVTEGDRVLDKPLAAIGGKGLFVGEVEAALTDGRADVAVHSMKDVPATLAPGLAIVAIPPREDPRDALVTLDGAELYGLVAGTKVGTSSLRRTAQLAAHRPDLHYATLRGNVDTRLRRLEEGKFGAVVLALAGLRRLGLAERPLWVVPPEIAIPAVGQGALAIEARADDAAVRALLAPLDDAPTRAAVEAERVFLDILEGSCRTPIAAHVSYSADAPRARFDAMVASLDGRTALTGSTERWLGPDAVGRARDLSEMAREVANDLLARGARDLVREAVAAELRSRAQLS